MAPLEMTTPNETTVEITRWFDAPKSRVWQAHTEADLIRQWMTGPAGHTMPECDVNLREGGAYRYVWESVQGRMSATGTFREIKPEAKLVASESFDIFPDNETLVATVFSTHDGKTRVTMSLHYDSKATRDAVLQTPMVEGLEASYRHLDALLAKMN